MTDEVEAVQTLSRWEEDEKMIRLSQEALFHNRIDEAEKILAEGMSKPKNSDKDSRDLRGAFGLLHALITLMKGLTSMEPDLLDECVSRLKTAEALAKSEAKWIGRTVVVSICELIRGIVLCAQKKFISGVSKIMWALPGIKALQKEGLDYEGVERPLVRSASLLIAGLLVFIFGVVPSRYKGMASYVTPFEGDREQAVKYFKQCFEERGFLSLYAALALCTLTVDTKTFFGEEVKDGDIADIQPLFEWQAKHFSDSVFFTASASDFYAVQRDITKARNQLESNRKEMEEFNTMRWVLNYKLALLSLSELDFGKAAGLLETSARVSMEAGRIGLVPFASTLAMVSYLQQGEIEKATEMAHIVEEYKEKGGKKKKWGRQDEFSFSLRDKYFEKGNLVQLSTENTVYWPFVDLLEFTLLRARTGYYMSEQQLTNVQDMLEKEMQVREENHQLTSDERIRYHCMHMHLQLQRRNWEEAMVNYEAGLGQSKSLTKTKRGALTGTGNGSMQYMHLMAATVMLRSGKPGAKEYLKRLEKEGKDHTYYGSVNIKNIILQKELGMDSAQDSFKSIDIAAGKGLGFAIKVEPGGDFERIEWNWVCEAYDIEFAVTFKHSEGEQVIKEPTRVSVGAGEVAIKDLDAEAGEIVLQWSNKFSYFRKKSLKYLITPPDKGQIIRV